MTGWLLVGEVEEYQLPAEPDTGGLPWVFVLLLLGSVLGEFGLVGLIEHQQTSEADFGDFGD